MVEIKRVLVPLAQGCEELEAVTVVDLLRRAGIEVVTASLDQRPVRCSRGICIVADTDLDTALEEAVLGGGFDMVVLPGGQPGSDNLLHDQRVTELLTQMADNNKYIAAICAAPKVLANAGLLKNRKVTSFPGVLDRIDISGMKYDEAAVVTDGNVITSRGPGTAMDFALELVELLVSRDKRIEVEGTLQRM